MRKWLVTYRHNGCEFTSVLTAEKLTEDAVNKFRDNAAKCQGSEYTSSIIILNIIPLDDAPSYEMRSSINVPEEYKGVLFVLERVLDDTDCKDRSIDKDLEEEEKYHGSVKGHYVYDMEHFTTAFWLNIIRELRDERRRRGHESVG